MNHYFNEEFILPVELFDRLSILAQQIPFEPKKLCKTMS
jgi:hypothetical protein